MPFNPKTEYTITPKTFSIKDFYDYREDYISRPPYQRKAVWSVKKQQALIDSLFRRYYIPKIVIREVRLDDDRTVSEVVDGQQRITTAQNFFDNKFKLPKSLADISKDLPGKYYGDLDTEFKRFIDKELNYSGDLIVNIEDPKNVTHQNVATEIFWRLQQGESLNFMEKAHARLASLVRNFAVKYADDETFDYESYKPVDGNPDKLPFFNIFDRSNDRMQHLLMLVRLLLIEKENGVTELRESVVGQFVDDTIVEDGIGNMSLEENSYAKNLLSNLNTFYQIFKDDHMIDDKNGIKELRRDYLVISLYLLLRHLKKYYVFGIEEQKVFKEFFIEEFYPRWITAADNDLDINHFSNNRQMDMKKVELRDRVLRNMFFSYAKNNGKEMLLKDSNRGFNEAQKISIYRRDKGLCQQCLHEGLNEKESLVSWSEYEADHVLPHSKGGQTEGDNGQVLCRNHNRVKSNRI